MKILITIQENGRGAVAIEAKALAGKGTAKEQEIVVGLGKIFAAEIPKLAQRVGGIPLVAPNGAAVWDVPIISPEGGRG